MTFISFRNATLNTLMIGIAILLITVLAYIVQANRHKGDVSGKLDSWQAAIVGVEVVMSTDFRTGKQQYIDAICAVSTEEGCAISKNIFGEMLYPSIEKTEGETICDVTAAEQIGVMPYGGTNLPIYRVRAEITNQKSHITSQGVIYAVVAKNRNDEWKLFRILFEEEAQQFEVKQ